MLLLHPWLKVSIIPFIHTRARSSHMRAALRAHARTHTHALFTPAPPPPSPPFAVEMHTKDPGARRHPPLARAQSPSPPARRKPHPCGCARAQNARAPEPTFTRRSHAVNTLVLTPSRIAVHTY